MKIKYYSFKNLMVCYLIIFTIIGIINGLCALMQFDYAPVRWNGQPVYGLTGFLVCLIASPLFRIFFAFLNYFLINGGRAIYNFFIKS
jgi:hypothetical protein